MQAAFQPGGVRGVEAVGGVALQEQHAAPLIAVTQMAGHAGFQPGGRLPDVGRPATVSSVPVQQHVGTGHVPVVAKPVHCIPFHDRHAQRRSLVVDVDDARGIRHQAREWQAVVPVGWHVWNVAGGHDITRGLRRGEIAFPICGAATAHASRLRCWHEHQGPIASSEP